LRLLKLDLTLARAWGARHRGFRSIEFGERDDVDVGSPHRYKISNPAISPPLPSRIFTGTRSFMASNVSAAPPAQPSTPTARSLWQKCRAFLLRYRVRITLIVFFTLIAEDALEGLRPHNLLNLGDWISVLGVGSIVAGLALRSWAAGTLHKTSEVTTSGPYALVRHPLYVGSFLMMVGFCLVIGDPENLWFVVGPLAFIYVITLLNEERILAKKFGERWQRYADAVPRFVPYRLPKNVVVAWSGRQWLGNREYNALVATALGLMAIQAWAVY
jgi:protein-S-isoprenylcysteine O-methyltransferase Ste14